MTMVYDASFERPGSSGFRVWREPEPFSDPTGGKQINKRYRKNLKVEKGAQQTQLIRNRYWDRIQKWVRIRARLTMVLRALQNSEEER